MSKGQLYIVSAPSGAGKTSLVKALTERDPQIVVSVSHTTRAIRPGEINGDNYHFVDKDIFNHMIQQGDFLEYAEVFDNFYGTSSSSIQQQLEQGLDVILEIDWQGARQVRQEIADTISVFIIPPSRGALRERLTNRGQDSKEIIDRRMHDAIRETSHYNEYDYLVVNDDFDQALDALGTIFQCQRLKLHHQNLRHQEMIEELLAV